ncbi:MAG: trans-aconitate 2-methyltransferase [Bdellovibrionales bacterium]
MTAGQLWDPNKYEKNARFVSDLGMPVVDLLAPKPGERILDVGCGDGVLTEKLAAMGCDIVGIDASPAFVAVARARGLDARVMKAQELAFVHEFNAVFSNAALHWIKPPEAVLKGIHRALKRGGRFVAEFGGQGNVAPIVNALNDALKARGIDPAKINPWYFPSDTEYAALLAKNGFTVKQIALIPRPTPLPGDVGGWLETFAGDFTAALPESERPVFLMEVHDRLEPQLYDAARNEWLVGYVRLRLWAVAN